MTQGNICPYESPTTFESLAIGTRDKHGFNNMDYLRTPINPDSGNPLSNSVICFIKEASDFSIGSSPVSGYWPNLEKTEQGPMIKLWQTAKDRERGFNKRVTMKPGKALRHMFPFAKESWIDATVTKFKERFTDGIFTVKTTETFDGFNSVYGKDVSPYKNPETTPWRKSLATSCMRYDARHFGTECHPCAVYGSGDFVLVYALDGQGRLAGRSVLHKESNTYGPIYGVCEASIDAIAVHMKSLGSMTAGHSDWSGARLVRVESGNGFVGPYLDIEPRTLSDNGDFLTISDRGEIDASDYSGTLGESGVECSECGCRVDEDESFICEHGEHYCESCYNDIYTMCEHCHEPVRVEDSVSVNIVGYRGRHTTETWCEHCADENSVICDDGETWRTDDCAILHNGDYASPQQMDNGEFSDCYDDNEYYPSDEVHEACDGNFYHESYLKREGYTYNDSTGIWELPEETDNTEEEAA